MMPAGRAGSAKVVTGRDTVLTLIYSNVIEPKYRTGNPQCRYRGVYNNPLRTSSSTEAVNASEGITT